MNGRSTVPTKLKLGDICPMSTTPRKTNCPTVRFQRVQRILSRSGKKVPAIHMPSSGPNGIKLNRHKAILTTQAREKKAMSMVALGMKVMASRPSKAKITACIKLLSGPANTAQK